MYIIKTVTLESGKVFKVNGEKRRTYITKAEYTNTFGGVIEFDDGDWHHRIGITSKLYRGKMTIKYIHDADRNVPDKPVALKRVHELTFTSFDDMYNRFPTIKQIIDVL